MGLMDKLKLLIEHNLIGLKLFELIRDDYKGCTGEFNKQLMIHFYSDDLYRDMKNAVKPIDINEYRKLSDQLLEVL
jgi:hypothetical protein